MAQWDNGELTVSTGTQRPFAVRDEFAEALRLSADKVRVIQPIWGAVTGGSPRATPAIEAAAYLKAAGKPVR